MDIRELIRERLKELGRDQRELAAAAGVTESYISQLLSRKKSPPAPERTDIYEKMEKFLKLRRKTLSGLARFQRMEELRRNLGTVPTPLNPGVREFVLHKCSPASAPQIRTLFEQDAFGPLERLVTQKLLDVVKRVARTQLDSDAATRALGKLRGASLEENRVAILEFLDTDVFTLSSEQCSSYMEEWIENWDIDLSSFRMDIVLNRRLGPGHQKRLELVEATDHSTSGEEEPGFREFLNDRRLSNDATAQELEFLKQLKFVHRRPSPLYYYRELQNLRDPLHFR